jgi:uncharacterized protein (DUF697 family)
MAFGRLRKIWEKITSFGKKVCGGIKGVVQTILPIAQKVAPLIATAVGGPAAGAATSAGLDVADKVFNEGDTAPLKQAINTKLGKRFGSGRGSRTWLDS